MREGHQTRGCRRVTHPESYITKYATYTKIRKGALVAPAHSQIFRGCVCGSHIEAAKLFQVEQLTEVDRFSIVYVLSKVDKVSPT